MSPADKSRRFKKLARQLGFDRAGVVAAGPVARSGFYRQWLAAGYAGSMDYLRRNVELREDPAGLLPGAASILCLALRYRRGEPDPPPADPEHPRPTGRVAQYARGADYHVVMRRMLEELAERLRAELDEPFAHRVFVDTGPLLERALAAAAGLGWIGKNTMLLDERLGSFLFLGEIVTTLVMLPDSPVPDHCGTCTRCLDACPTRAFPRPYQLDASRCIAYFTIEHRGEIPPGFQPAIGDWVFGCDVCQEVCPYNRDAPLVANAELSESRLPPRVELTPLVDLTCGGYRRLTRGTAAGRATRAMWRRNARIALRNATGEEAGVAPAPAGPITG